MSEEQSCIAGIRVIECAALLVIYKYISGHLAVGQKEDESNRVAIFKVLTPFYAPTPAIQLGHEQTVLKSVF